MGVGVKMWVWVGEDGQKVTECGGGRAFVSIHTQILSKSGVLLFEPGNLPSRDLSKHN